MFCFVLEEKISAMCIDIFVHIAHKKNESFDAEAVEAIPVAIPVLKWEDFVVVCTYIA